MSILLCDATNLLVRSAHAANRTNLSNEDGVPTAALLIFINMISRHVREERPEKLVLCWDGGKSLYREAIWSGYKGNRGPTRKDEPERPIVQAKEWATLAGLHHVERQGFEADDLIANYWRQVRPTDTPLVILSGDKDFLQLITNEVQVVRPLDKGLVDRWDVARVRQEYGCEPHHLPYVKALMGDSSDGIPGLPGVGPKKAVSRVVKAGASWFRLLDAHTPQEREILDRNLRLMDLRYQAPQTLLSQPPLFDPVRPGSLGQIELMSFLDRYQLNSVRSRLLDGTLWPSEERPSS